jgi:type I restriction enzyme, S subunit
MTELPESWEVCTFADVTTPIEMVSSSNHDDQEIRYIDISSIDNRRNRIADPKTLRMSDAPSRARQIVKSGDVLFSTVRPYLRNIAAVPDHLDGQIASTGFAVLRAAPGVSPAYLFFKAISRDFVSALTGEQYGVSYPAVKEEQVRSQPFELPPTDEQHRIVAKIEALFSELDAGQDSLTRAQAQLKLYRQSLLKAAFQGRLTADWRKANRDKLENSETLLARIRSERDARYKQALDDWQTALTEWRTGGEVGRKPAKPKLPRDFRDDFSDIEIDLPELLHGWAWGRLGYATCGVEYGTSAKSSVEGDVPVIRMGNLQNGLIDWTDLVFTSDEDEVEQYLLSDGDVLFNRTNSPELVGKTAIYRGERPALFAGYLVRVNQIDTIALPEYICYFLNSHQARRHGDTVKTDGVNQSNINGNKLQEYPFPFCAIEEQAQLILILDEKISAINAIETEITTALAKLSALRQSILKKAFSGQLVPQDPTDEPAAALLSRLRNAAPTPRRKTKA